MRTFFLVLLRHLHIAVASTFEMSPDSVRNYAREMYALLKGLDSGNWSICMKDASEYASEADMHATCKLHNGHVCVCQLTQKCYFTDPLSGWMDEGTPKRSRTGWSGLRRGR